MKRFQRIISGWLTACLIISMLPVGVLAAETKEPLEEIPETTAAELHETVCETARAVAEPEESGLEDGKTIPSAAAESVSVTNGTCGDNLTWSLEAGVLTISGEGEMEDYSGDDIPWYDNRESIVSVSLPEGLTNIGHYAFYELPALMQVVIPGSVAVIGDGAFRNCSSLAEVTIADGVATVGWSAFEGCSSLKEIVLPDSVTDIGHYTFQNCAALTEVTLSENISTLGQHAFGWCTSLKEITIPDSVKTIVYGAFYGCTVLTDIVIPDSVTSLDGSVFGGCSNLASVTLPSGITAIGDYLFYGCTSLTDLTIPTGVTSIGQRSFYGCTGLTAVHIPDTVASIGPSAFAECTALPEINIPDAVTSIAERTFEGCTSLASVTFPANLVSIGMYAFGSCGLLTASIPQGTTSIGYGAFSHCSLTSVTLPDSLTSLGNYAFSYCSSLAAITIPGSLAQVSNGAFSGCRSLTELVLCEGVTGISEYAFFECRKLAAVTIPSTVTSISNGAFNECNELKEIRITDLQAWCGIAFESYDSNPLYYSGNLTVQGAPVTELVIPEGTTQIPPYAFYNLDTMTGLTVPGSVSVIGASTFMLCDALTEVVLSHGVAQIGADAFNSCEVLSAITIPATVTSIGDCAFEDCYGLTDVYYASTMECWEAITIGSSNDCLTTATIHCSDSPPPTEPPTEPPEETTPSEPTEPAEPEPIAKGTCGETVSWIIDADGKLMITGSGKMNDFRTYAPWHKNRYSVKEVSIAEGITYIGNYAFTDLAYVTDITIPNSVTAMGYKVFSGSTNLTRVRLPESITAIREWTFDGCSSLTDVVIPAGVTSIGEFAFRNCTGITGIVIPEGVTSIGDYVFYGCAALGSIVIPQSVKVIGDNAFFECVSLTDVELSEGITTIGGGAFWKCCALRNISLPDSITSIGYGAFGQCSSLAAVHIPQSLQFLGEKAFCEASVPGSIVIPGGVKYISENAFEGASGLTGVVLSEGVMVIGENAFSGTDLDSVSLPDSLTRIGEYAFKGTNLSDVDLPEKLEAIGVSAFSNCNLSSVVIPESITRIEGGTFTGNNLTSAFVHAGVTYVGNAFSGDNLLITYDGTEAQWRSIVDAAAGYVRVQCTDGLLKAWNDADYYINASNLNWKIVDTTLTVFGNGAMNDLGNEYWGSNPFLTYRSEITHIVIEEGVTSIGNYAFSRYESLVSVDIADTVTSIGTHAFAYAGLLSNIVLPRSLKEIEGTAFYDCKSLKIIVIPYGMDTIRMNTFASCSKLETLVLPRSVETIEAFAFMGCPIRDVYYAGTAQEFSEIRYGEDGNEFMTSATIHCLSYGPGESGGTEYGMVVFSDNSSMSVHTGSRITLSVGVVDFGEWITDTTAISVQIADSSILSIDGIASRNNRKYVTFEAHNTGVTNVTFLDSKTGLQETVMISVYDQRANAYNVDSVPVRYIEKYPTNIYNFNGLYVDSYSYTKNSDGSVSVSFDVYNTNYIYGAVEIVDQDGTVLDAVLLEKMTSSNSSLKEVFWDNTGYLIRDIFDGDLLSYRRETGGSRKTSVNVTIPANGYIKICINPTESLIVGLVNYADLLMNYASLAGNFTDYAANSGEFSELLVKNLLKSDVYEIIYKDGSSIPKRLAKNLFKDADKDAIISLGTMQSFAETLTRNLDDLDMGSLLADTAGSFGWSLAGKLAEYFTGPISIALNVVFGMGTYSNLVIMNHDMLHATDCLCFYIQNQNSGSVSSQQITVKSETGLPENAALNVYRVMLDEDVLEGIKHTDPALYTAMTQGTTYTYDISISQNGTQVQPGNAVTVSIQIPEELSRLASLGKASVYRVEADGSLTDMEPTVMDGHFVFSTEHFSLYSIVAYEHFGLAAGSISIPQDYLAVSLTEGDSVSLQAEVTPETLKSAVRWDVEAGGEYVVAVTQEGGLIALSEGTAYVLASVTDDIGNTLTARCRVDVTRALEIDGVQLSAQKLTSELYSTDYAELDIVLLLPQNLPQQAAAAASAQKAAMAGPTGGTVAIDAVRFTNPDVAQLFELVPKDDRTVKVVPTQAALENPRAVPRSFRDTVTVTVRDQTYETESLTVTVKQTMPKLKATIDSFYNFYSFQSQKIKVTGATVTGIACKNLPDWLTLEDGILSLTETVPAKGGSAKLTLQIETEEWAVPVEATLSVKCSYKTPNIKLSTSSVQFSADAANSAGVQLQLQSKEKNKTLEDLGVTDVSAPTGYTVSDFSAEKGTFTLKPENGFQPGKINLEVIFGSTTETMKLPLTVKTTAVSLKLSTKSITLNSRTGDSAAVTITSAPANYQVTAPKLRLEGGDKSDKLNSGELGLSYDNGKLSISTTDLTPDNAKYTLYISAAGGKETALKISTTNAEPTLKLRTSGNLDLSFPNQKISLTTTFKNHSGGLSRKLIAEGKSPIAYEVTETVGKNEPTEKTEAFILTKEGSNLYLSLRDGAELNVTSTYMLYLTLTLEDGSTLPASVKIPVKQTAVNLKLSSNKVTLNNTIADKGTITVTCTTKGYALEELFWQLTDKTGKESAEGKLDVHWSGSTLNLSVNDRTEYGATYKLLISAEEGAKATVLTVNIPVANKSGITGTLKLTGALDVVRDGTAVTVTPTFKNCDEAEHKDSVMVKNGNGEDVTDLFTVKEEEGKYILTRAEKAKLDPSQKYTVTLTADFGNGITAEASAALKLKMGSAKLTLNAGSTTLFANDRNSRVNISFVSADTTLNKVAKVEIKDAKLAQQFELFDYGNGHYAIGFKDGVVPVKLTSVNLALNIWLEGNETAKTNASVKMRLTLIR